MKKRIIILISVLLFLILSYFVYSVSNSSKNSTTSTQTAEIYFLNQASKNLEPEKRVLAATTASDKIDEILRILLETGPLSQSMKKPTSVDIQPTESSVVGHTAIVYFDNSYNTLSSVDRIYLKSSVTWSLTSISDITSVMFYVDNVIIPTDQTVTNDSGQILNSYKYDRSYVLLNPSVDPQNLVMITLDLYFVDENNNLLSEEVRSNVYADPNKMREFYIVDELIKGTTAYGLTSYIPKSTKIIKVATDNNICYVTLSQDFISKQPEDEAINRLAVYQIVNSLTLLDEVDAVQILIDSKKVEGFSETLDLSDVLTTDNHLLSNQKQ